MTNADVTSLAPCSHEEADARLFVHAGDAVLKGHGKLCICTVHTDAILTIIMLKQINPHELWLAFGTKVYLCYIPVHEFRNGSYHYQNFTTFSCIHWM